MSETTPNKERVKYEALLERMQCSLEGAQTSVVEEAEGVLLGGVPFIEGLSEAYPNVAVFLAAHLIGPADGPQGSAMLWVNEEGLTLMAYIRDTDVKAFFNGTSLGAVLREADEFLGSDPIPWRATRKARKKASKGVPGKNSRKH